MTAPAVDPTADVARRLVRPRSDVDRVRHRREGVTRMTVCSRCGSSDWSSAEAPRWVLGWRQGLTIARCVCGDYQPRWTMVDGEPVQRPPVRAGRLDRSYTPRWEESPYDLGDGKPQRLPEFGPYEVSRAR